MVINLCSASFSCPCRCLVRAGWQIHPLCSQGCSKEKIFSSQVVEEPLTLTEKASARPGSDDGAQSLLSQGVTAIRKYSKAPRRQKLRCAHKKPTIELITKKSQSLKSPCLSALLLPR